MSSQNSTLITKEQQKVSCLMVTADRKNLMRRAVRCFQHQTYTNKELVVIDDGQEDLEDVLKILPASELTYLKLEKKPDNTLGKLRNYSLEEANGNLLVQWDDDDWYHPERIATQTEVILQGYDACCLSSALMHLNEEPYLANPYLGTLPKGIPGSIMHRRNKRIRYPDSRRAEDTVYQKRWMEEKYIQLPDSYSYLFIRCYHGENTWSKNHFLRRLRNNSKDACKYLWYKKVKGNLFEHPKFKLNKEAKMAFEKYMKDSEAANLLSR